MSPACYEHGLYEDDMTDSIRFWLDDEPVEVTGLPPTTTLLRYLRDTRRLTGTKEGCAEGDCGACTVAVLEDDGGGPTWRAVNACLVFLPMVHGKRVVTVAGLREGDSDDPLAGLHPSQAALVELHGSQCGYCTPGIVMALFEATYRSDLDGAPWAVDDSVAGNLCRCTGYRPIRDAVRQVAGLRPDDRFAPPAAAPAAEALRYQGGGQTYLQPASLDALWSDLAAHPDAVLAAGGTDLGLEVTKRHAAWPVVVGLEALDELRDLRAVEGGWRVGAGVRLTRLSEVLGQHYPGLEKMLRVFGSRQIRSRATVGGNLCNASPIGDLAPVLLALDAAAVLGSAAGERRVPLGSFFTGYRQTALRAGEILVAVEFPDLPPDAWHTSYKVSKRRELDISIVAAGMCLRLVGDAVADIRLAWGGVAATPVRAAAAEAALRGGPWTREAVLAASAVLDKEFSPISDHRGSAAYRSALVRNLLLGFFLESSRADRDALLHHPTATVSC